MFVGRDREADLVAEHLRKRRPVAVVGPVGVGKTALATETAASVAERVEMLSFPRLLSSVPFGGARRWIPDLGLAGDEALAAERVVAEVARGGIGALVLDDLQWADPQTRDVVRMLVGKVPLVATVRLPEGSRVEGELEAAGFEMVELAGLEDESAARLLASLRGDWTDDEVDLAVSRAGGNPLLCIELAADHPVPGEIETWMRGRLEHHSRDARTAMCLLSLLGRPATTDDVPDRGVDELVGSGIAVRGSDDTVAIRCGLLAELAVEEVDPDELQRLHGLLADRMTNPDEALAHAAAAGRSAEVFSAASAAAEGATSSGSRTAYLVLAARHAPQADRRIRFIAADAAIGAGEGEHALDVLGSLADADARGPDWAIPYSQAVWEIGDRQRAHDVLEAELADLPPDDADAVTLLSQKVLFDLFETPASPSGMDQASRAIALAEGTGASAHRARFALGFTHLIFGSPQWSDMVQQALAESEAADDTSITWWAREVLTIGSVLSGRVEEGRSLADEAASVAADSLMLKRQRLFETYGLMIDLFRGCYRDALTGTARLLRNACDPRTLELVKLTRALALIDVGADMEAREQLRSLEESGLAGPGGRGMARLLRAEADFWRARPERALREFAAAFEALPAFHWYGPLGLLSYAWAAIETDAPLPQRGFIPPVELLTAAHREWDGLERWSCDGPDEGVVDALVEAAASWTSKMLRNELRCLWGAGEVARLVGDGERAATLLRRVEQESLRAGLGPLLWRARRSLRQAGLSPLEDPVDSATDTLTALERKVVDAARTGASNSEIARRLGVSPSTVTYYFRRIEKKLGAESRHGVVRSADRSLHAPLVVVSGDDEAFATTRHAMRAAGWNVIDAATSETAGDAGVVRTWCVRERSDAEAVLLAALSGQGVLVHTETNSDLADQLLADLRRVGRVEVRGEGGEQLSAALGADEQALLDLLAAGLSTEEAARRIGWSRRTVFRRLTRVRETLGVETTADAVAMFVHQGDLA